MRFLRLPDTDWELNEKAKTMRFSRRNLGPNLGLNIKARVQHAIMGIKTEEAPPVHIVPAKITTTTSSKKMKKWPDNPSELVAYNKLIDPLKEILNRGYRLFRKNEVEEFDYDGFNIGKLEQKFYPPPNYRFAKQALKTDDARNVKLIDVVLNVVFLLGIEQGRRTERKEVKPIEVILETLDSYRALNKDLRIKIDELEVLLEIKKANIDVSDEELSKFLADGIKQRREKRIEEAKSELTLDKTRSSFEFQGKERLSFKQLEKIGDSLTRKSCTKEQWEDILQQHGWTYQEWENKCKKKHSFTPWLIE